MSAVKAVRAAADPEALRAAYVAALRGADFERTGEVAELRRAFLERRAGFSTEVPSEPAAPARKRPSKRVRKPARKRSRLTASWWKWVLLFAVLRLVGWLLRTWNEEGSFSGRFGRLMTGDE